MDPARKAAKKRDFSGAFPWATAAVAEAEGGAPEPKRSAPSRGGAVAAAEAGALGGSTMMQVGCWAFGASGAAGLSEVLGFRFSLQPQAQGAGGLHRDAGVGRVAGLLGPAGLSRLSGLSGLSVL